jgi:hypothetical protein
MNASLRTLAASLVAVGCVGVGTESNVWARGNGGHVGGSGNSMSSSHSANFSSSLHSAPIGLKLASNGASRPVNFAKSGNSPMSGLGLKNQAMGHSNVPKIGSTMSSFAKGNLGKGPNAGNVPHVASMKPGMDKKFDNFKSDKSHHNKSDFYSKYHHKDWDWWCHYGYGSYGCYPYSGCYPYYNYGCYSDCYYPSYCYPSYSCYPTSYSVGYAEPCYTPPVECCRIVNPLQVTVTFTVSGQTCELAPGASREVPVSPNAAVGFDRGFGAGSANRPLTAGMHQFAMTPSGLDLIAANAAGTPATPPAGTPQ